MILETERLLLREFKMDDAAFVLEILNTEGWIRFIGDRNVRSLPAAQEYISNRFIPSYAQNGFGLWLVIRKDTQTAIGICGLIKRDSLEDIDIGFAFLPEYCGVGFALESASAVLNYAADTLQLKRIVAITTPDNAASIKLLERIGLIFTKTILFEEKEELFLFSRDLENKKH